MGIRVDKRLDEQMIKKVKKQKKSKIKRVFLVLLILILVSAAFIVGYGYFELNKISKGKVAAKKVASDKPVNILLLGVDAGDYTNHTKNNPNRSDTMMLVRYNPKLNKADILSIPRDTRAILRGRVEKLNAAHAMGGVDFTISSIEKLFKVDINYYAEINYEGFKECVDAIGGVDIKIPREMNYDAWKINIHFKKGEVVHMNGEKAEQFVRWRKNNDGTGYAMGDIGRISTQQDFIVEVVKKLKTPSGILRLPLLINTVSNYIETNIGVDTILSYANKARSIKPEMIHKEILSGVAKYIGKTSYYVWDNDLNNKFLAKFRGIEPVEPKVAVAGASDTKDNNKTKTSEIPSQTTEALSPSVSTNTNTDNNTNASNNNQIDEVPKANSNENSNTDNNASEEVSSNISVKRSNMEVIILNSTGKAGLAKVYKQKLEKLGYRVTQTDNYLYGKLPGTLINDYSKNNYAATLYNDLKFGKIVTKTKAKPLADLVVILGTDSLK